MEVAKPMWAIREEIGTLASKIRERILARGGNIRDRYERGDQMVENEMKSRFKVEVYRTYVDLLGMSKDIIDPLIDEYIAYF
jgi:hypothetical protein